MRGERDCISLGEPTQLRKPKSGNAPRFLLMTVPYAAYGDKVDGRNHIGVAGKHSVFDADLDGET